MRKRLMVVVLALTLASAGCGTLAKMGYNVAKGPQGSYEIIETSVPALNFNDYYALEVGAIKSAIGDKCPSAFLAALPTQFVNVFGSEPYFALVEGINNPSSPKSAGKTLVLSGDVVDYNTGSSGARAVSMGEGTFVTAKTTFVDKASGKTLCVATVRGRSKSMAEGGFEAIAEGYARGILKLIKEHHMKMEKSKNGD